MVARFSRGERQPQQRPAHEQLRGHQVRVHAVREHEDVKADQSHVVGQRHPRKADIVLGEAGATSVDAAALARMLRWVSTTPLGSLVEPEENWMKATSSRLPRCTLPAREMSSS